MMKWILTILILILQILQALLVLLPVLSGEAPLPHSFTGESIGLWFGQIFNYWQEVFEVISQGGGI